MEKRLKAIYTDPKNQAAFTGPSNLYKAARAVGLKVTLSKVKEFLSTLDVYTLHKQINRKFKRNVIYASSIDTQWSSDLLDFQKYSDENKGYRYVLVCIDVLSRYLWARGLKNKKPEAVVEALQDIFKQGRLPKRIRTDRGQEYMGKITQAFFKKSHIVHMLANSENKSSLSERVGQTLQGRMYRYFTHSESHAYIDKLQDFVNGYNNSVHRMLRMKPADVNKDTAETAFFNLYALPLIKQQPAKKRQHTLSVGQPVRVTVLKDKFERSYGLKWSGEFFKIAQIIRQSPKVLYELIDYLGEKVKGYFYRAELQPIKITKDRVYTVEAILKTRGKGKKKEHYVSWLGWGSPHNSWVPAASLEPLNKTK